MEPQNTQKKVIVGMSGGVDSSAAAALLVEQGYDVIGITLKTFNYEDVGGGPENESSCCSLDGINDARLVASSLGIPHYVLDFSEPFGRDVIGNFIDEYLAGKTPNPCVICNRKIKWEELLLKADALGAAYIATGHYAKVRQQDSRHFISTGTDTGKDQSYALWGLTQESLRRTIFPLADLTKTEARSVAQRHGLRTAGKGESFEICFITDNSYERFLKEARPGLEQRVAGGDIVLDGRVIGKHRGYPFYTIGQRKGIGVAMPDPIYVTQIDSANNVVTVGYEKDLYQTSLSAIQLNLMKYDNLREGKKFRVKVRYKDEGAPALVTQTGGAGDGTGTAVVRFDEPKRSLTPGQSVVFYEGNDVVGGGIIDRIGEV
jgi:tRNA-uridine 2-sulfurtransferase